MATYLISNVLSMCLFAHKTNARELSSQDENPTATKKNLGLGLQKRIAPTYILGENRKERERHHPASSTLHSGKL